MGTVVICLLCTATWRAVKVAAGDLDPHGPTFACGLFDPLMAEPIKKIKMSRVKMLFIKFVKNIFIAPITVAKVSARVYGKTAEKRKKWWPYAIPSVGLFSLFIFFHLLDLQFRVVGQSHGSSIYASLAKLQQLESRPGKFMISLE